MNARSLAIVASRRAFSLIEVLIGVLILALGLLGLGAVIPVVVREQRSAADVALGTAVANSAQEFLTSLDATNPQSTGPKLTIWDQFLLNGRWGYTNNGDPFRPEYYKWELKPSTNFTNYWYPSGNATTALNRVRVNNLQYLFNSTNGTMTWSTDSYTWQSRPRTNLQNWTPPISTDTTKRSYAKITVLDRLWPTPQIKMQDSLAAGRDPYRPQFVWDFVARRLPPASPGDVPGVTAPAQLQVAVFVRRIDLNITLPPTPRPPNTMPVGREFTLFSALAQDLLPTQEQLDRSAWRVPVAEDADGLPTRAGIDTRDQANPLKYSQIKAVDADIGDLIKYPARDVLKLTLNKPAALRLLAQPGQKLVDNLGNIYTVRGVPDPDAPQGQNELDVVVDPPVPLSVLAQTDPAVAENQFNSNVMRQVIFTAQIPANVRVFTISRPVMAPAN